MVRLKIMAKALRLFSYVAIGFIVFAPMTYAQDTKFDNLLNMSLSELMQVKVLAGTLTSISRNKVPAATTRLYQHDIQEVGARSLMELLEITVPSLQVIRHHWELPHLGLRGITGDKEDKVMIRVNGRMMNERIDRGAITERDFPLMRDIKHIDIIRGAGSSMYGLGAVSLVIDITTYDAASLEENSVSVRGGIGMPYYAFDGNYKKRFKNGVGLYLHTEVADIKGANSDDAPVVFGADGVSIETGETIVKGESFPTNSRDGEGYDGEPFLKGHIEVDYKETKAWMRYTKAGRNMVTTFQQLTTPPTGFGRTEEDTLKVGYEQLTVTLEHKHQLNDDLEISWMASYDQADIVKKIPLVKPLTEFFGEDEIYAKVIANWYFSENSEIALGSEISYEHFSISGSTEDDWYSNTVSLFGEWQWRAHQDVTAFFGSRMDKNKYSEVLFSPRASLIYSDDNINFYKLLYTKSQRIAGALESRRAELAGNNTSKPEVLNSIEMRYEQSAEQTHLGVSAYYIDLDVIGWDNTLRRSVNVGKQTQWGTEAEIEYQVDSLKLMASYAYTKLIDFDLYTKFSWISASPFGYGNDLADWATHSVKIWGSYSVNSKLKLTSSLRAFWGYDGSRDFRDKLVDDKRVFISDGWEKAYRKQVYLNMGARYKPIESTLIYLDLHNVLGIFDSDINKRLIRSLGSYRSETVAISAGLSISF